MLTLVGEGMAEGEPGLGESGVEESGFSVDEDSLRSRLTVYKEGKGGDDTDEKKRRDSSQRF
jgi:hypothetical protein